MAGDSFGEGATEVSATLASGAAVHDPADPAQEDYRGFSCQLAGHALYQRFCLIDALDQVRVPSKSELQRFAHWLPAESMREVIEGLLQGAIQEPKKLGLKEALDLGEYFLDSTCLKANIHFPTDWVLQRDGVRTLMKATRLIRQAGLRGRMEAPEEFLRRMNRLSIQMSQQARRVGSKKGRKRVLRQMKKLVGVVRAHSLPHQRNRLPSPLGRALGTGSSVTRLVSVRFRYSSALASRSFDASVAAVAVQVASCLMNNYMAHLIGFARSTSLFLAHQRTQRAQRWRVGSATLQAEWFVTEGYPF